MLPQHIILMPCLLLLGAPALARAEAAFAPLTHSSTTWGTNGVHRVESARPLAGGDLVLLAEGHFFAAKNLFADGDRNRHQGLRLGLAFAPLDLLTITLAYGSSTNANDITMPETVHVLGDPVVGLKLGHAFTSTFAAGVHVVTLLPTSPAGRGLSPNALSLSATALLSYRPLTWLELSANAGYRFDNTHKLFAGTPLQPSQRFTGRITEIDSLLGGIGVLTEFFMAEVVILKPFAELTGAYALGLEHGQHPLLASAGLKVSPAAGGLEASVVADYRLSGAPVRSQQAQLPGEAPWQLFLRLTAHLNVLPSAEASTDHSTPVAQCSATSQCATGQQCIDGACVIVREVVQTRTEIASPKTFVVQGTVTSKTDGKPPLHATISITGATPEPITLIADPKSGAFSSWPIPESEGLLQLHIDAPGHRLEERTIPRGPGDTLKIVLSPATQPAQGQLRGIIKDSTTGRAVEAKIFLPTTGRNIAVGQKGGFSETLNEGEHQLLISAPGYVTQKKDIMIRSGDTVILNIDLQRTRR